MCQQKSTGLRMSQSCCKHLVSVEWSLLGKLWKDVSMHCFVLDQWSLLSDSHKFMLQWPWGREMQEEPRSASSVPLWVQENTEKLWQVILLLIPTVHLSRDCRSATKWKCGFPEFFIELSNLVSSCNTEKLSGDSTFASYNILVCNRWFADLKFCRALWHILRCSISFQPSVWPETSFASRVGAILLCWDLAERVMNNGSWGKVLMSMHFLCAEGSSPQKSHMKRFSSGKQLRDRSKC